MSSHSLRPFFLARSRGRVRHSKYGYNNNRLCCQSGAVPYFSQSSGIKLLSWVCLLFLMKFQHSRQHKAHGSNTHFALKIPEIQYILHCAGKRECIRCEQQSSNPSTQKNKNHRVVCIERNNSTKTMISHTWLTLQVYYLHCNWLYSLGSVISQHSARGCVVLVKRLQWSIQRSI